MTTPNIYAPKVYLSGPDVFLPNAAEIGKRKVELCDKYGFKGLFPLDNEIAVTVEDTPQNVADHIYLANKRMMDECDCAIVNLTPFRGASADVGTVFEMGYLIGINKPVFGYSNTRAVYLDRIGDKFFKDDKWIDRQGYTIENFNVFDNLMLFGAIWNTTDCMMLPTNKVRLEMDDLSVFEEVLYYMRVTSDDID